MKMKWIPLLLCISMLAACLVGCGSGPAKVEVTESPAPAETQAPTEAPVETPAETPAEEEDPEEAARRERYQAAYEKYAPDQTVMLINNEPITSNVIKISSFGDVHSLHICRSSICKPSRP